MFHALFTARRAAEYEAERRQAELTRLAAESARAETHCLIGLVVLFLLALCCA